MRTTVCFLLLVVIGWAEPRSWTGSVLRVLDGDTVRLMSPGGEESVRLDQIDAPEIHQAGGKQAKRALERMLPAGRRVSVESQGRDRYRRVLAQLYLPDGTQVNVEQVRNGQAWVYTKYCRDFAFWQRLEASARARRLGLWAQPNPIPPWEYRHPSRP